jgi:hypothetical protein
MSDYLWDKTGEPEEDVEQLENLLGALKYQTRPLDIPLSAMPNAKVRPATIFFTRPRLAIAASLLLTLLAGMWFVTRQGETQKNDLAKVKQGSETVGNEQPEQAVVTNDTKTGDNDSINNAPDNHNEVKNAVAPKQREDRVKIVTASARKVNRAPRGLVARRRKLQPRLDDAPAPREYVATNGEMRWVVEQPLTPQQREATEKLMLALQVASAKFNYAQREMQEIGRAGK